MKSAAVVAQRVRERCVAMRMQMLVKQLEVTV